MEKIAQMMADLGEESLLAEVKLKLEEGSDPLTVLEACREGMSLVGTRFEKGEYFLSELIMASEIFKQVGDTLAPHLAGGRTDTPKGKVIMGTVKGDIHYIGKDIVIAMLKGANYEVEDLGVDVSAENFVEAVKKTGATIVGMSGLMTFAFDSMKATIEALKKAGLSVKVMIGGGPVTEQVRVLVGADGMGANAQVAVTLCDQWIKEMGVA